MYSRLQCQTFQTIETQLFQLYVEVTGVLHDFMPVDLDDMLSLEDASIEEVINFYIYI